ncbi:MAG: iron-sulfur cluster repair di-iron protein [Vicingaceae bacterium]
MDIDHLEQNKVASVVANNIKAAHVFKKHGIDFCCGGGISIEEACRKNNAELENVLEDLDKIGQKVDRREDYNSWNLDFLIDHIVQVHHSYVLESLPILLEYSDKVAKVHGHHYAEVMKIRDIVTEVCAELSSHLQKEERVLFPYVKYLVNAAQNQTLASPPPFGNAKGPIQVMVMEHEHAGDAFKEMRKLSNDFTPPAEACNTFRALYALLDEFEIDLHLHIHLENNILFPKALLLEKNTLS